MAESPLSPVSAGAGTGGGGGIDGGGVSEVGMNVVVDLHSSASAVLNENSTASTGSTAGIFVPVDLQCPATPQLNLKLPDLSTSSSESDDETALAMALDAGDGLGVRNTSSPPPNCAICLGRCKNKCFTDSCMHQFCFKCLCEWSKVKPECPLCKQTFKSIIHNVKSIDQFEEYHVVTPPTLQFRQTVELNMLRDIETNLRYPYQAGSNRRWEDFEVALNNVPRAHRLMRTARTTFYPSSSSSSASASIAGAGTAAAGTDGLVAANAANNGNVQNQFVHRGELLDMYRQEYPDAVNSGGSLSGTLSQLWRRYVYDRKLYALPVCDITGRFRESSARFYRDNPAQMHRLMPWINRDIVCLLRNTEHDVSFVLERINEWLTMTNILSPLFRRRLQPILGSKTAHFIHELNNFARSPYDMIGYDRAVQYSPQNTEEIIIEFSTSSSSSGGEHTSDEEQVNVVDSGGAAGSTGAIDGSSNNGAGNAVSETSRTHRSRSRHAHGQTSASRAREYRVQSRATANTASNTPPMINLLSFTISTTSEGVEAPGVSVANVNNARSSQSAAINLSTHNRTSDVIIELDDTDIDNTTTPTTSTTGGVLQYAPPAVGQNSVTAQRTPTVTDNIELSSTSSSDECEFVLERKPPHLRTPEMVSLNSESDSDVVFVAEEEDHKLKRKVAIDAGATTEDQLKCVTRTMLKKLEAAEQEQRSSEQRTKVEEPEEYNVGATTSAGLPSSGRRRRQKSIDMEKSKLRKQERRKRSLRSTKDGNYVPPPDSTSSDSDDGSLALEVAAYREKQRLKRLKKKSYETRRTTRRTAAATTSTTIKSSNKTDGPRMIRTTRLRKRKYSTDSDYDDRARSNRRRSKALRYGASDSERSEESETSQSESDDMDTALRELSKGFSKTIKGLKRRSVGSEGVESECTPSTSNNRGRSQNEQELHEQEPNTSVIKYEHDEASNMMQHSSEEDTNSQRGNSNNNNNEHEHEEENESNSTANGLNLMETMESSAMMEATAELPYTSTTATESTTAQQEPLLQLEQIQQQQLAEIDDTISLNVQVTSPRLRSSSRSLRSSIYTSSTTSSSDSSTTSSSSSSSSSSDDSDGGHDNANFNVSKRTAFKAESGIDEQQLRQQVVEDCYNMMDLETLDAATTEAVAALASLRNSNHQQLSSCRHPYLDNLNNHEDANGDSDDGDDYENDEM